MKLRLTRRAIHDLIAIRDYIEPRSPAGAAKVRTAILESLRILAQFPSAGLLQSIPGVRKLVTRRYPYLIYYQMDSAADEIHIITIQHSSREREYVDD